MIKRIIIFSISLTGFYTSSAMAFGNFLQVRANVDTVHAHKLIATLRDAGFRSVGSPQGPLWMDITNIKCQGAGLFQKIGPVICSSQDDLPLVKVPKTQDSAKNKALIKAVIQTLSSVKLINFRNPEQREMSLRDLVIIDEQQASISMQGIMIDCLERTNWGVANTCMVAGQFPVTRFLELNLPDYECKSKAPNTCWAFFNPQSQP